MLLLSCREVLRNFVFWSSKDTKKSSNGNHSLCVESKLQFVIRSFLHQRPLEIGLAYTLCIHTHSAFTLCIQDYILHSHTLHCTLCIQDFSLLATNQRFSITYFALVQIRGGRIHTFRLHSCSKTFGFGSEIFSNLRIRLLFKTPTTIDATEIQQSLNFTNDVYQDNDIYQDNDVYQDSADFRHTSEKKN